MSAEGSYGIVSFEGDLAIKKFKHDDTLAFMVELFYLSFFKGCKGFCEIIDANVKEKTITMKRYDGSLSDLKIKLNRKERCVIAEKILNDILPAIDYLHNHGINHADIKCDNVFYSKMDGKYQFVLGDFSLTSVRNDRKTYGSLGFCDCLYADPDSNANKRQTDLWFFGITLWEFITGDYKACIPCENLMYQEDTSYLDIEFNFDFVKLTPRLRYHLKSLLKLNASDREIAPITKSFFGNNDEDYYGIVPKLTSIGIDMKTAMNIFENVMCNSSAVMKDYPIDNLNFSGKEIIKVLSA